MATIEKLELENFKSYRKQCCIEWRQFSAIIGLNGSGKSTLIDAIKFVFCLPPFNKMSIEQLFNEILNGHWIENKTTVKILLKSDEETISFERVVDFPKSKMTYFVNEQEVNLKTYKQHLLNSNINPKANNFLIEQNSVEIIAIMGAKERSEYFEHLSGSIAFKSEYNRLNNQLLQIKSEIDDLQKHYNFHSKNLKKLKKVIKKSKNCDQHHDKLKKLQRDYHSAKLFAIDKMIEELQAEKIKMEKLFKVTEKLKGESETIIINLKESLIDGKNDLENYDNEVKTKKEKITKYLNELLTLNQHLLSKKDNIMKFEENLNKAKTVDTARENIIKDLEHQLQQVEEDKATFKSQSQSPSIELEQQKYAEYLKLKSDVLKMSTIEVNLLDSIDRERDAIKDKLDDYERQKDVLFQQINQKQFKYTNLSKQIEQIKNNIKDAESNEKVKQDKVGELRNEAAILMEEIENSMLELANLNSYITECKDTIIEDRKSKKKQEVLRALKNNFRGVYGRVKNLCSIEDDRYKVAITKAMGVSNMDAIVVDTLETARECIKFLKSKFQGNEFSVTEKFLPIDYVKTKSLDNALKSIENLNNVKLALNVVKPNTNKIQDILNHLLGNVVICETEKDASNISKQKRINCVTLDGTFYHRDGMISGGLESLAQKSKEWNDEEKQNLKEQRNEKLTEVRKLQKQLQEKQDLMFATDIELKGLNERLTKHLMPIYKERSKELENLENELTELKNKYATYDDNPEIINGRQKLKELESEYEETEARKNAIEDTVFEKFCTHLGISNIRVYELGDFKKRKEYIDREKDYENLTDKIKNQITFEMERDTKSRVENWESRIKNEKAQCKKLEKEKEKLEIRINELKDSLNENEAKLTRNKISEIEKALKIENNKIKLMKADQKERTLVIAENRAKILQLKAIKHDLILECKVKNINIPLLSGKIKNVLPNPNLNITATESSDTNSSTIEESMLKEKYVEIDYSRLSDTVKNLDENGLNDHLLKLQTKLESLQEQEEMILLYSKTQDNFKIVKNEFESIKSNFNKKKDEFENVMKEFENVKAERFSAFDRFFKFVSQKIDEIFKVLFQDETAQIYLTAKNLDEPYTNGIDLSCVIPGKRFTAMEGLSGGEKAMCALALLIAIHEFKPMGCLIFDEIDAALDVCNREKLSSYLEKLKYSTQIISISHHALLHLYSHVIIVIHMPDSQSSSALHIDTLKYDSNNSLPLTVKSSVLEKYKFLKDRLQSISSRDSR